MTAEANTNDLRVPFGLKQGRLYPPQDTDRGLACECMCPCCGSALIANQGNHKRPYFSHYQSRECAGGYESAVHLMAKQIIKDRGYIVLPEYRQSIESRTQTGDLLSEVVRVPSKRVDFVDVRLEQTIDGLRPDVIGVTSEGTEVLIEVYVTHAVTDSKRERFTKRNLIELNLSKLPRDLVVDENKFAEEVLFNTGREWISCQLYRDEISAAHQTLKNREERFNQELQQRRLAEQAAETKRSEKKAEQVRLVEQAREKAYLERQEKEAPELEQLRVASEERWQQYQEEKKKRIQYRLAMANTYVVNGVMNLKRCDECRCFQELTDGEYCLYCDGSKLSDVKFSLSYLETLPHRLRSVWLPPLAHED